MRGNHQEDRTHAPDSVALALFISSQSGSAGVLLSIHQRGKLIETKMGLEPLLLLLLGALFCFSPMRYYSAR